MTDTTSRDTGLRQMLTERRRQMQDEVRGRVHEARLHRVLDIGPLHATADRQKTLPLPPVLGIVAVAGGVVLLIAGVRKRA